MSNQMVKITAVDDFSESFKSLANIFTNGIGKRGTQHSQFQAIEWETTRTVYVILGQNIFMSWQRVCCQPEENMCDFLDMIA